jgi:hypothetical protein
MGLHSHTQEECKDRRRQRRLQIARPAARGKCNSLQAGLSPAWLVSLFFGGIALLGDSEFVVVDAKNGLGNDLDGLAGDALVVGIFPGAEFSLYKDGVALFERAGEPGQIIPGGNAEPVGGFVLGAALIRPLFIGGDGKAGNGPAGIGGEGFCIFAEVP